MSKSFAVLVGGLTAVVMPVLLVLSLAIFLHKDAIKSIYKNVDDISDGEMPATVTSFQSGPEVVSTIKHEPDATPPEHVAIPSVTVTVPVAGGPP